MRSFIRRDPGPVGDRIAERFTDCVLQEAIRLDLPEVYLLSQDTGGYFERLGWREAAVAELAARLPRAPQVRRYDEIGWYPNERAFVRRVKG
jgi:N-acetylglutamate synthase-like GNAT family acetyltransferase